MDAYAQDHRDTRFRLSCVIVCTLMALAATSSAFAQDRAGTSFVRNVVKKVILDPTTYAPAIVAWGATRLDWRSSQIFFQNGWLEHNRRFTVSGHGDDIAIGYAAGNRRILTDALSNLQFSAVNNVSERV